MQDTDNGLGERKLPGFLSQPSDYRLVCLSLCLCEQLYSYTRIFYALDFIWKQHECQKSVGPDVHD